MNYFSFVSVLLMYPLVKLLTKNNFNKTQMIELFLILFTIGLAVHYDRYPDMYIESIIMALFYPFMGYLALIHGENRVKK